MTDMLQSAKEEIASWEGNVFKWTFKDEKDEDKEKEFNLRPSIFAIFHLDRNQVMAKMNYFGNKEHKLGIAMDTVAGIRLVTIKSASHAFGGLVCVTAVFGGDSQVPKVNTYPEKDEI